MRKSYHIQKHTLSNFDKIEILCKERDTLNNEVIMMEQSLYKALFTLVTGFLVLVGLITKASFELKNTIIIFLSQFEFILGLFVLALWCNITIHAGYTEAVAKKLLKEMFEQNAKKVSKDAILKTVSNAFGINISKIKGTSREKKILTARQVAMYLAKEKLFTTNQYNKKNELHSKLRDLSIRLDRLEAANSL